MSSPIINICYIIGHPIIVYTEYGLLHCDITNTETVVDNSCTSKNGFKKDALGVRKSEFCPNRIMIRDFYIDFLSFKVS